jgi:uncharacterized protein with GYD domain
MPKYLGLTKFTSEGLKGLRSGGAASRVEVVRSLVEGVGGKLEGYYFAFGEIDVYAVLDLPDDETAAAISLAAGESGVAAATVVKLLTPEQVDAAYQVNVGYRPPGQ